MRYIGLFGSLALLTACTGAGSHLAPTPPGSGAAAFLKPVGHRYDGLVFVSDLSNNAVWICKANFNDIRRGYLESSGQLQGVSEPAQLAVDAQGTVYVANAQTNAAGAGAIAEYPRGATSPSLTLTSGLNTTTGVAVDSNGTVYASNKYLHTVVIFPKGRTKPKETIRENLAGPDGLAVDKSDNLYVADGSANDVLKLAAGSKTPQSLHLQKLKRPVGVAVDSKGDLFVSNLLGPSSTVAMYPPGSTAPKYRIVVPGPPYGSESTIAEPAMISITKPGDILIVSSPISLALIGGAEWFGYAPAVVGYASGQTQPLWSQYVTTGYDAVFQSDK